MTSTKSILRVSSHQLQAHAQLQLCELLQLVQLSQHVPANSSATWPPKEGTPLKSADPGYLARWYGTATARSQCLPRLSHLNHLAPLIEGYRAYSNTASNSDTARQRPHGRGIQARSGRASPSVERMKGQQASRDAPASSGGSSSGSSSGTRNDWEGGGSSPDGSRIREVFGGGRGVRGTRGGFAGRGRGRGASAMQVDGALLTHQLTKAGTLQELEYLLNSNTQHGGLNAIHIAAVAKQAVLLAGASEKEMAGALLARLTCRPEVLQLLLPSDLRPSAGTGSSTDSSWNPAPDAGDLNSRREGAAISGEGERPEILVRKGYRELVEVVWAFGKLQQPLPPDFRESVLQPLLSRPKPLLGMKSLELTKMASSLATLKYHDPVAWSALAAAAESRMSKFSPRAVSGLLWAFAVAKESNHDAMIGAAAFHASSFLPDFLSQDLATSLWALSRLGYYDQQLYNDFADEVRRKILSFPPQELSMVLVAFASMQHTSPKLSRVLGQAVQKNVAGLGSQSVVNAASALQKLGVTDPGVYHSLGSALSSSVEYMTPGQLLKVLSSFCLAGQKDMSLYKLPLSILREKMPELSAEKTAKLLAVAAKLGVKDPQLAEQAISGLLGISHVSTEQPSSTTEVIPRAVLLKEWNQILRASAKLGLHNTELLHRVSDSILQGLNRLLTRDAARYQHENRSDTTPSPASLISGNGRLTTGSSSADELAQGMSGLLSALSTQHRHADRELATAVSKLVLLQLRSAAAAQWAADTATNAVKLNVEEQRRDAAMQRMRGLRVVPEEEEGDSGSDVDGDAKRGVGDDKYAVFSPDAAAQLVCALGEFAPALTAGNGGRACFSAVDGLMKQLMPGFIAQIATVSPQHLAPLLYALLGLDWAGATAYKELLTAIAAQAPEAFSAQHQVDILRATEAATARFKLPDILPSSMLDAFRSSLPEGWADLDTSTAHTVPSHSHLRTNIPVHGSSSSRLAASSSGRNPAGQSTTADRKGNSISSRLLGNLQERISTPAVPSLAAPEIHLALSQLGVSVQRKPLSETSSHFLDHLTLHTHQLNTPSDAQDPTAVSGITVHNVTLNSSCSLAPSSTAAARAAPPQRENTPMTLSAASSQEVSQESVSAQTRVCLAVVEESRCSANRPYYLSSTDSVRHSHLQQTGWTLVSVPAHSWNLLQGDPELQKDYLRIKLQIAGLVPWVI